MTNIEIFIALLLLFMAVPDVCQKLSRPALAFPIFVIVGMVLRPLVGTEVAGLLSAAGEVGFLLLLFEVGLEIELPPFKELRRPARFVAVWILVQYPFVLALASFLGLKPAEAILSAAALTGCSVGMAHPAWKIHPGLDAEARQFSLHVMVLLEAVAVVAFAAETTALKSGPQWSVLLKLLGAASVIVLVGYFARHFTRLFQKILESATHWRTHLLILLVLVICAVGERLGLSAPKTAFFLGLFMSRAEHDGKGLEEFTAPVSQRFLIPLFFVALGMKVDTALLVSWTALFAFGCAGLLLGIRQILHRRWLRFGAANSFLLLCPNLTIVALGAVTLAEKQDNTAAAWVLLTGLFLTVSAILLLPGPKIAAHNGN
ncbi:MAG TPA: cation:proton antiporter [Candidatus Saccharimonadales bacterium]|nr:cation:proton antiporter [Candidatus Saccharimonadales bacterium]